MATEKTTASRAPKGRAPQRRNEDARLAVLHAADDLLVERGFGGVTVEGIAARAGVAKQTIYRWWPSKVDILLDTLVEDADKRLKIPDEGPVVDAVRSYLRALARFLTKEDAGKVLLALLGEAQHEAETATLFHERYLDPRRARERALLKRGVAAGELPAGVNLDATLDSLIGPIVYRALTGAPVTRGFVDALVDRVLES
ncbi:MAG TPA: TetR/AcrR family transcriptional regulator [Solirubrobacterales bacterium]